MHRLITASATVLLLVGCGLTPEQKLDRSRAQSESIRKDSGYYECMARLQSRENSYLDCYNAKIANSPKVEDSPCYKQFGDDPRCHKLAQGDAEMNAQKSCNAEVPRLDINEATCDTLHTRALMDSVR